MKRFHSPYFLTLTLSLLLLISGMGIYSVLADSTPTPPNAPIINIIPNFSSLLISNDNGQSGILLQSDGISGIMTSGNGLQIDNKGSTGLKGESNSGAGITVNGTLTASGKTGIQAIGAEGGILAISTDTGISVNDFVKGIFKYTEDGTEKTAEGIMNADGFQSTGFGSFIGGDGTTFLMNTDADFGTFASITDLDINQAFQSATIDAPGLTATDLNVNGNVDFDTENRYYFKTEKTAQVNGNVFFLELGLTPTASQTTAIIQSSNNNPLTIDDFAEFKGYLSTDGKLTGNEIGDIGIRSCAFTSGTNSSSCDSTEYLMSCSAETSSGNVTKVYPKNNACYANGAVTIHAYCFSSTANMEENPQGICASSNSAITGSIQINDGDSFTDNSSVTLTISASGASKMCISNTASCTSWETYATSKNNWKLTSDDGTKTVSIWFKDSAGNNSSSYNDSIILDTAAPTDGYVYSDGVSSSADIILKWAGFSDSGSGIDSYILSSNTKKTPDDCSGGSNVGNTNFYSFSGTTNQTYYFRLCAQDNTGKISTGATTSVHVPAIPY